MHFPLLVVLCYHGMLIVKNVSSGIAVVGPQMIWNALLFNRLVFDVFVTEVIEARFGTYAMPGYCEIRCYAICRRLHYYLLQRKIVKFSSPKELTITSISC